MTSSRTHAHGESFSVRAPGRARVTDFLSLSYCTERVSLPDSTSTTFTVPLPMAAKRRFPSGLNATVV